MSCNGAPAAVPAAQITGLLLAGGRGSRMGGADKGLLPLHGEPLAAHVLRRLRPQVGALLVSANRHAEDYARLAEQALPGSSVLPDEAAQQFAGPLAGLAAGLRACATPWLLSAPCDAPFLPADLALRLGTAAVTGGHRAAAAFAGGRLQPVFVLLHRELLDSLLRYLAGGQRKVETWLEQVAFVQAAFDDPAHFDNINLPQQLAALHQLPDGS